MTPSKKTSKKTTRNASTTTPTDVTTLAESAVTTIDSLEAGLPIVAGILPAEQKSAEGYSTVTDAAIGKAVALVLANPSIAMGFDVAGAETALTYTAAMKKVSVRLQQVAKRIDRSILKERVGPAQATLALYATLQGVVRQRGNEKLREPLAELEALISGPIAKGKRKAKAVRAKAPVNAEASSTTASVDATPSPEPAAAPAAPAPEVAAPAK